MTSRSLLGLSLTVALLLGCARSAPSRDPSSVAHDPPRPAIFASPLDRDHPLVGKIWDVRARAYVDDARLLAAAHAAHFVLLGEKHDNADHHALQAWVASALASSGRAPAIAFEQFEIESQPAIDDARRRAPNDADAIARATAWDQSGWPPWEMYAPIARVAVTHALPIVAANLAHATARRLVREGSAALADADRARLGLTEPLPAALEASLRHELHEAHCGMEMPARIEDGMILAERARDATMADRMRASDREGGVVLIAGTGHTRIDRGVPLALARIAPALSRVSIAFVEVDAREREPAAYGAAWGVDAPPFDYVFFTPRANDDDPCAKMRESHPPPAPR